MHIEGVKDQQKSSFYIAQFENIVDDEKKIEEAGFNRTVYLAYCKSKASKHKLIDFDDVIWENDVEAIVTILKENDIKEFTISCKFCDLIDRLAAFEKLGCKIDKRYNRNSDFMDRFRWTQTEDYGFEDGNID